MSATPEQPSLVSISVRVRRTITQDAYVSVLVRDAVMKVDEDGAARLDPDRIFARAVELGGHPDAEWRTESTTVAVHPTQSPPPAERAALREVDMLEEEG